MRVLLVDDDKNLRAGLKMSLERSSIVVSLADSFNSGLSLAKAEIFDVLIFDIKLGELTGIDLFSKIKETHQDTPVIFISSGASLSEVAEAMRIGAFDFLEKPFSTEKLVSSIQNASLISNLKTKVEYLESGVSQEIVGASRAFISLMRQASQVAKTNSTVLITGESGTGKELLAKKVHDESSRKSASFIKVNCSAIPENLIESELFGYEKGAFTGAERAKKGFFELAHKGTLFLDEIGDMSLASQTKILRALQDSEIQKLGSEKILNVDVRVIAATNKNLKQGIKEGWFREDLYFRINVFPMETIPLRERKEDIPLLADSFLKDYMNTNAVKNKTIDYRVYEVLKKYSWPGNIRELKNTVERLAIISFDKILERDLNTFFNKNEQNSNVFEGLSLKEFKEKSERKYILDALIRQHGVISDAAKVLGIERTYLHKKITQYKINKKEYFGV